MVIIVEGKKFDVLQHVLVPRHRLLDEKEKEELFKKYRVKPTQLPRILETDPVVKALGAKKGDVIEIIREEKGCMKPVRYYRIVV